MIEEPKVYKYGRVRQGGLSSQRRRNEPIGNIGERRLMVMVKEGNMIYVETTKDKSEVEREAREKEGWRYLTTYFSDEKGIITLPKGLQEKYIEYLNRGQAKKS